MELLLNNLRGLADLKLIPVEFMQNIMYKMGVENDITDDQKLRSNGYATSNLLLNMGGFAIVLAIFLVLVILLVIFGLIMKFILTSPKWQRIYKKLHYKVFWGLILQACIHSYIKLAISNMINLNATGW